MNKKILDEIIQSIGKELHGSDYRGGLSVSILTHIMSALEIKKEFDPLIKKMSGKKLLPVSDVVFIISDTFGWNGND